MNRPSNEKIQNGLKSASTAADELLYAAEGLKQLGTVLMAMENSECPLPASSVAYLVHAMGRHIQTTRNKMAENLEPAFESLGVEPIGY